jgi:hypothetical protein
VSGGDGEGEGESARSFFEWFNPDEEDEDLAQVIRDEIWPDPLKIFVRVQYFLNQHEMNLFIF